MASFCAKCGAQMSPEMQFCAGCGTPAAAGAAAVSPVQPVVQPARSGGALKVILIIVAIVAGLGILGVATVSYMVWHVARNVNISSNGDHVSLKSPDGSVDIGANDAPSESDLGTAIYPGAEAVKGGMKMKTEAGTLVTGVFLTSDSKEKVVEFYKGKFGSDVSVMDAPNAAVITQKKGEQESVMVTVTSNSAHYEGKTQITVTHSINSKPS